MISSLKKYKTYKKNLDYSYSLGAFATYELIKKKTKYVEIIVIHSLYQKKNEIETMCKNLNIDFVYEDKFIEKISLKENCFVIGIFNKFNSPLNKNKSHIVLVNPSDMGNLGTIIRTMVGFNIFDLAIINPSTDIFNPKSIRASMGAIYNINFYNYDRFGDYKNEFFSHDYYPFLIDSSNTLTFENCPKTNLFSLIFGNEAKGLDKSYKEIGQSVSIKQSDQIDSLNLSIAVGIGIYIFSTKNSLL